MRKIFSIIGTSFGLIGYLMIVYLAINGVVNSAKLGTWDIFDTIMLPITIISFIFTFTILIQSIKNSNNKSRKIFEILMIIISFIIGFLYIWFACVKSDNNIFYAIIGSLIMSCSILLIVNIIVKHKSSKPIT